MPTLPLEGAGGQTDHLHTRQDTNLSFVYKFKNEFRYFANLKFGGLCSFKKRKLRMNREEWEEMDRRGGWYH